MRAFVGIALDAPHLDALTLGSDSMREASPEWRSARWVPAENLHVTLKFLGNIPDTASEEIASLLRETLSTATPATVRLDSLRALPNPARARMLWAVFVDPQGTVARLAGLVEKELIRFGIPPEKRAFSPHVTLARSKKSRPVPHSILEDGAARARSALGQNRVMSVGEARLYKSTLSSAGATYEILARIPLDGPR